MLKVIARVSLRTLVKLKREPFSSLLNKPPAQSFNFDHILQKHQKYLKPRLVKSEKSLFTDEYLLDLLRMNYFLNDSAQISTHIIFNKGNKYLSDIEACFIAHSLVNTIACEPVIINIEMKKYLTKKVINSEYSFQSEQVERYFLNNFRLLVQKTTNYKHIEKQEEIFQIYMEYLIGKYQIFNNFERTNILQSMIKLCICMPVFHNFSILINQKLVKAYDAILVVKYLAFLDTPLNQIEENKSPSELSHFGAVFYQKIGRRFNPYKHFHHNARSEEQFYKKIIFFMEFNTYRLLKTVEFSSLNSFHQALSFESLKYKTQRIKLLREKYVQSLISHKVYDIRCFQGLFKS